MKKIITLFFLTLCTYSAQTQTKETIHWASGIVDVSSEKGRMEHSALQVLHKPNVLPSHGEDPNAWTPAKDSNDQFIVVYFDEPFTAQQIAIAESQNPGSVKRIYAYDTDQKEYLLFDLEPKPVDIESRLLNLFFEKTDYKIEAIRVELDVEAIDGDQSIDAIGISDSNIPINVLINLAPLNQKLQAEKLGENVNSEHIEHSPILSPDGKKLYFSRRGHPDNIGGPKDEDIWYSELDEQTGEWLPAKNIGPPLNTEGPNFISAIIPDGDEQILLLGNKYGRGGKMYAGASSARVSADGVIGKPKAINIINDYNYSAKADYYPSMDEKVLLMSIERDDSYGNRDIYVSFIKGKEWSEPLNLGGVVNSIGEEAAPYLLEDNKTLYYSSDGFSGFGGSDLYVTKRLDNSWTKWSEPENMGAGINSTGDDIYITMPSFSSQAYFTRGDADQNTDIFTFKVEELYIDNIASKDSLLLASYNPLTPEDSLANKDTPNGAGDLPDNVTLVDVPGKGANTNLGDSPGTVDLPGNNLTPDNGGTEPSNSIIPVLSSSVVYFDFNSATLKDSYKENLSKVVSLFESEVINALEIHGHTDSIGSHEFNHGLSERRANTVKNYFIRQGVTADKLKIVPNGENKPATNNDDRESRALNRRVELTVTE